MSQDVRSKLQLGLTSAIAAIQILEAFGFDVDRLAHVSNAQEPHSDKIQTSLSIIADQLLDKSSAVHKSIEDTNTLASETAKPVPPLKKKAKKPPSSAKKAPKSTKGR